MVVIGIALRLLSALGETLGLAGVVIWVIAVLVIIKNWLEIMRLLRLLGKKLNR